MYKETLNNRLRENLRISQRVKHLPMTGGADNQPSEIKVEKIDDNNLYVNIQRYNPLDSPIFNIPCESDITQASPLLENPSKYRICCERFTLPASNLPLFVYPDDDVGEALYKVEVYDTQTQIFSIIPLQFEDWNLPYSNYPRGVYYYQQILGFINYAIYLAFLDCAQTPSFPYSPNNAPTLEYEPSTQLFYFNLVSDFDDYFSGRLQIRFSRALYDRFFPTFAGKFYLNPDHLEGEIIFTPKGSTVGLTNFRQYNEVPCIAVWNTVAKLLVLSNTIPVSGEVISSTNNKNQMVLMDFEVESGINTYEPFQFYSNLHRWYDLTSTSPLYQLQVSVNVQFRDGQQFPLQIQKGEFMSFKFLIRSKTSQLTN